MIIAGIVQANSCPSVSIYYDSTFTRAHCIAAIAGAVKGYYIVGAIFIACGLLPGLYMIYQYKIGAYNHHVPLPSFCQPDRKAHHNTDLNAIKQTVAYAPQGIKN
jgi:hypothetical protein